MGCSSPGCENKRPARRRPPMRTRSLLIRMKVMDMPDDEATKDLYRTLLELNATEIVHGAYGIEDGDLILSDTLELETLDFLELQASMESITARGGDSHGEDPLPRTGNGAEG